MKAKILLFFGFLTVSFAQTTTIDVCAAADVKERGDVLLRGTGGVAPDAPLLFDYTCPVGSGNAFVLPMVVLLQDPVFKDSDMATRYRSLKKNSIFQALIRGRLECPAPFQLGHSDDGDIIGGNGYGPLQLYRCRMLAPRFLVLHIVDTSESVRPQRITQ